MQFLRQEAGRGKEERDFKSMYIVPVFISSPRKKLFCFVNREYMMYDVNVIV